MQNSKARFDFLDAVRGLAAIFVMLYHYTQHNGLALFRGAWVAVDLFFLLSGFVLAYGYGEKIVSGMRFYSFLRLRLLRLGPLYFFGLFLGLIYFVVASARGQLGSLEVDYIVAAFVLNLFWLPYINNHSWPFGGDVIVGAAFPLNDPAWSLFFEVFVNIVFYFYIFFFKKFSSIRLVVVSLVVFVVLSLYCFEVNPGWGGGTVLLGIPRVVFGFFAGALIFQTGIHERIFRWWQVFLLGLLVLFVVAGYGGGKLSFVASFSLIPFFLAFACRVRVASKSAIGQFKILGLISYPLYIVHFPIYRLCTLSQDFSELTAIWQTVFASFLSMLVSLFLYRLDNFVRLKFS